MKQTRLYIFTFLGIAASILVIGYFGVAAALDKMEHKYIELQLDVNKRQAESMAKFLQNRLNEGFSKDSVMNFFQQSILGTDVDKGFLCMFDKNSGSLVCHPNLNIVGMTIPDIFRFNAVDGSSENRMTDFLKAGKGGGGLFHKEENKIDIAYLTPVEGTDWLLASHENVQRIRAEVDRQRMLFQYGFFALSFVIALLATLMARFVGRRYEKKIEAQNSMLLELNEELNQQKEEISAQRDEITKQKSYVEAQRDKIEAQNDQITASIRYAARIQGALLPPERLVAQALPEHFIFYRPRDIVSGDFYWIRKIGNFIVYAVADSTGHGVPGAFMSMLGIAFLNEIVSEDFYESKSNTANLILNNLREKVKSSLRQDEDDSSTKDGMDIALIILNTDTLELQYAGAHNSLYIVRNNELTEVKADNMPIGIHSKDTDPFTNKRVQLQKEDCLYMFSDGYQDQFGGSAGRKFLVKRFRQLLLDVSSKSMSEQEKLIAQTFDTWRKNVEQVDDVLVSGFRI